MLGRNGKEKTIDKKDWAIHKYISEDEQIEVLKWALVGDKVLEEYETKNKAIENDIKASVYCDIKVTKQQEEILLLPPEHQTFPKLDIEEFETYLAKSRIKERWESLRESREREESNVLKEITDIEPEKVVTANSGKVYDRNTKSMDIINLKATDLKNNKGVIIPELDNDESEIRRNHVSNELKEVFIKYKDKKCNKFGNIKKNNLSKTQLDAIKNLN